MPGRSRWSVGRPCSKMPVCDFGRFPGCLGAALRRLPISQFGSLTHGHKTVSTLLSFLLLPPSWPSSPYFLVPCPSLLLAHTATIRGLPSIDYGSSQSPKPGLASHLLCSSLLDRERSCLRTRILQPTLQRGGQEASIYEPLRRLHEITHEQNGRSMKRVRGMPLPSRFMGDHTE